MTVLILRRNTTVKLTNDEMDDNLLHLQGLANTAQATADAALAAANATFTLSAATDTNITNPQPNQVLSWNGTDWANTTLNLSHSLATSTDANITNPTPDEILVYNGTDWVNRSQSLYNRIRLTADLTLYVSPIGSDVNNTGLTIDSPFQTIQHAWDVLFSNYDLNDHNVTIQLADGTYTSKLHANGLIPGQRRRLQVYIQGNALAPNNVIIHLTSNTTEYCIEATNSAILTIRNMKFLGSGAGQAGALAASFGGFIDIFEGINFGACTGNHVAAAKGSVVFSADYTISGGTTIHMLSEYSGSYISANQGITVTITGNPAFSQGFAISYLLGLINIPHNYVTYTGTATGYKFQVAQNSIIYTSGGGVNYFPGNVAGFEASGGQYF